MIRVFDDHDSLSHAAAEQIAGNIGKVVQERGECRVALSGGHTPQKTYRLLAAAPFKTRVPWEKLEIFWGDERCVPPGDKRNNASHAYELLLDHVAVAPKRVHPIVCQVSPRSAAQAYEDLLRGKLTGSAPILDVTLLGLGTDGHTASMFPQSPILQAEHRWVAELNIEEEQIHRVSMTPILLNQSHTVIFLVSGSDKAAALKHIMEGPYDPLNWPAQLIKPNHGQCIWMVDRAAAAELGIR